MRLVAFTCGVCAFGLGLGCATTDQGQKERDLRKAIASQLIGQRDWSGAFGAVARLYEEAPEDPEVLYMRGLIYREQRLYTEAEADLVAVRAMAPDRAAVHGALAILYDTLGRAREALAAHRKAAELAPEDPGYLNNLGFSLYAHRKTREAITVFREALRVDPTNRRIRNNLGFAFARAGDFAAALKEFSSAGSPGQARNNLGFAYEQQGNLAAAYELYVEALRLDPALRRARSNLAHVAPIIGRPGPEELGFAAEMGSNVGPAAEKSQQGENHESAQRLD